MNLSLFSITTILLYFAVATPSLTPRAPNGIFSLCFNIRGSMKCELQAKLAAVGGYYILGMYRSEEVTPAFRFSSVVGAEGSIIVDNLPGYEV